MFSTLTLQDKIIAALGGLLLLIGILSLAYFQGRSDGKSSIKLADEKALNAAAAKQKGIDDIEAKKRIADATAQAKVDQAYADAIAKAPGGKNSPAAVAYGCQQLRRAGYSGANLPAECGR